jgi:hypothetical protein
MNRHGTDTVSLTFGLIFLLVAGWWVLSRAVDIAFPTVAWAVAVGLIAVGALGLVGTLRGGPREPVDTGWNADSEGGEDAE